MSLSLSTTSPNGLNLPSLYERTSSSLSSLSSVLYGPSTTAFATTLQASLHSNCLNLELRDKQSSKEYFDDPVRSESSSPEEGDSVAMLSPVFRTEDKNSVSNLRNTSVIVTPCK